MVGSGRIDGMMELPDVEKKRLENQLSVRRHECQTLECH
jgi:hypothetical protein